MTAKVAVYAPARLSREPGSGSSTCCADAYSPWPPPFAPPTPLRSPPQTPPQWASFALFAGFIATMTRSDFSGPCIIGFGSSPSRCGPPYTHGTRRRRPDTRSPRFRCDPFARHVALDPGRASAPRITVPALLPSSELKPSAPAMSDLSWLNPTPHAIAVYASQPTSPLTTQHSLPSGRYSLLGPDFHRLDRTSFAWRTHSITSSARASSVGRTSRPSVFCGQCGPWPSNSPPGRCVVPSNPGLAASCGTPQCGTVPPDRARKGPSARRSAASGWTAAPAPQPATRPRRREA